MSKRSGKLQSRSNCISFPAPRFSFACTTTSIERFIAATPQTEHGYASFLGTQLQDPGVVTLVAEREGEVIGYSYAGVDGHDYMSLRGPAGVLHDVWWIQPHSSSTQAGKNFRRFSIHRRRWLLWPGLRVPITRVPARNAVVVHPIGRSYDRRRS